MAGDERVVATKNSGEWRSRFLTQQNTLVRNDGVKTAGEQLEKQAREEYAFAIGSDRPEPVVARRESSGSIP